MKMHENVPGCSCKSALCTRQGSFSREFAWKMCTFLPVFSSNACKSVHGRANAMACNGDLWRHCCLQLFWNILSLLLVHFFFFAQKKEVPRVVGQIFRAWVQIFIYIWWLCVCVLRGAGCTVPSSVWDSITGHGRHEEKHYGSFFSLFFLIGGMGRARFLHHQASFYFFTLLSEKLVI